MNKERTCIGCRRVAKKGDLLRIARSDTRLPFIDVSSKAPGRGAYVCSDECFYKVLDNGRLSSALRVRVSSDMRDALMCEYKAYMGEKINKE